MSIKSTLALLTLVVIAALYIFLAERNRFSTDERRQTVRQALRFEPEDMSLLRIDTPSGLFIVEKTNSLWRLMHPVQAPADAGTVLRILDTLAGLRKSEIITVEQQRTLKLDTADYGFNPPRAKITLGDGRQTVVLLIGRDAPGGHQLYIKREDLGEIMVTSRDIITVLPGSVLDLRDRRLFGVQPGRVRRIEWQSKDKLFYATKDEDEHWQIERPVTARGSGSVIRQWLDQLYEFRVHEFIADSVAAGSLYGFDEPIVQISLYADKRVMPQTLKIGRSADINQSAYYAMIAGQDTVFTITAEVFKWLMTDTATFRDSRLLAIPAPHISFIQVSREDRVIELARTTQDVWEVIKPKRITADDYKIQRLLSTWTGAQVEQYINPPIADPGIYGLSKEKLSIRFSTQVPISGAAPQPLDRDALFLIGDTNANGNVYISPFPPAYVMELSGKLLEEISLDTLMYRNPVILTVAPTSVRRLVQRAGKEELAVERTDSGFRALTSREIPDANAVDQILKTIARLQVVEYIEEDPLDLEKYGLQEPIRQLIIGLTGTTGFNKVLLFGNQSASGDYYVMVQGNDVVFTLPAETAGILLKPVAGAPVPAGITQPSGIE